MHIPSQCKIMRIRYISRIVLRGESKIPCFLFGKKADVSNIHTAEKWEYNARFSTGKRKRTGTLSGAEPFLIKGTSQATQAWETAAKYHR